MNVLANRIKFTHYEEAMNSAYDNLTEAQEAHRKEIQAEEKANGILKWYETAEERWH